MTRPILINGKFVEAKSNSTIEVHNPATLELLDSVPACGEADVNAAVRAARAAQRAWWRLSGVAKAELLHEVAHKIRSRKRAIGTLLTQETGKPLIESVDCVQWVAECFDYYAEVGRSALGLTVPPGADHQVNFIRKEPYGVVGCIAPFNFPLLLMAWKVAPAIAAGNTVVCKPPHQNPLSGLLLGEVYDGLPPGVVNIITGAGDTGGLMLNHPGIDMIAFTGSTAVGKHIASVAGSQLKKINLELGGIDPLLVFEDADIDIAARGAVWARLLNAGQVCTSSKRIYVVEPIAEEFTKRVVEQVKTLNVGNPMDSKTDMGPLISADAVDKLEKQLSTVLSEGGKLLAGGKRFQPNGLKGHFFQPTVVAGVRHGGIATTEELFGPVVSIFYVKDANEAIEKANDSEYGLGATVFTKSLELAMHAMENIKAGSFWINDPLADNNAAPFGGMRHSGIGRELGTEGLDAFREPKHVHLDYVQERKPDWFPYAKRAVPQDK
jgi:acyl-CoA reductase-like NAD-dependent aldehyde dehydrogenase